MERVMATAPAGFAAVPVPPGLKAGPLAVPDLASPAPLEQPRAAIPPAACPVFLWLVNADAAGLPARLPGLWPEFRRRSMPLLALACAAGAPLRAL
jgi:hypothetical protein